MNSYDLLCEAWDGRLTEASVDMIKNAAKGVYKNLRQTGIPKEIAKKHVFSRIHKLELAKQDKAHNLSRLGSDAYNSIASGNKPTPDQLHNIRRWRQIGQNSRNSHTAAVELFKRK